METLKCICQICGKTIIRKKQGKPVKYHFCNNRCKAEWQKRLKNVTKEWLEQKYIEEGLNCTQIAYIVNRNSKSVWLWLKGYGIPTRPRGHDTSLLCKDGSLWMGKKHSQKTKNLIKQARLKDGHVPYLKNGEHWLKSVKKEQHPSWKGGITPERQDLYSTEAWADSVKAVWKRDKGYCQKCNKHHNTCENRGTFHIHHIISFQHEKYRLDIDNLVLLCKDCHIWIHSKQNKNKIFIKEI